MTKLEEKIASIAKEQGVDNSAFVDVDSVVFKREFRDACAVNACGKYGACWMCPPDIGDIDGLIAEAKAYKRVFVYQTIGRLEDSFDIEGMEEAARRHNGIARALSPKLMTLLGKSLHLCAGACHLCGVCAKKTQEPCRFPDKAVPSLESYGVSVSELASACGLKYINGENTVTYFGGFLYG